MPHSSNTCPGAFLSRQAKVSNRGKAGYALRSAAN